MRKLSSIIGLIFLLSVLSAFTRMVFITPKVEAIEVQPIIKSLDIIEPKLEVKVEIPVIKRLWHYYNLVIKINTVIQEHVLSTTILHH